MKDELLHKIINDPDAYGSFYVENCGAILDYVKQKDGLKSDAFIADLKNELDKLRFSSVFSDFTNIYPEGIGSEGNVVLQKEQQVTINDNLIKSIVVENQKPILHAGYIIRNQNELSPFLREIEPLIEADKAVIHNSRLIMGLTNEKGPDGKGRVWQTWNVNPSSPIGNWLTAESAKNQNSIPIDFKPKDIDVKGELFQVSLPYLKGIPFSELVKVLKDNEDLISNFRKHLKDLVAQSKNDGKTIEEMKNDLVQPEIEKINRKFKSVSNIRALKVGGTVLSTAVIGLMTYPVAGFGPIISSFFGVGGMGLLVKNQGDFLKEIDQLKDNPLYLMWKIKKKKK